MSICPLCLDEHPDWTQNIHEDAYYLKYFCPEYTCSVFVSPDIISSKYREQLFDLIVEYTLHHNRADRYYIYDELSNNTDDNIINLYNLFIAYPKNLSDKANRSLFNLSKLYPHYGDEILNEPSLLTHVIFCGAEKEHVQGMLDMLVDLSYLNKKSDAVYSITSLAWKKIEELEKNVNHGFIAMSFRDETKPIREAFRTAISNCGYIPMVIDEKDFNGQIVPEIFYEIKRSKFVVVDVTYPNYGAYYEAGYAQALGKQVIICCRRIEFESPNNRPHFDIAQKSMIVWDTEDDLINRLEKRILSTVE